MQLTVPHANSPLAVGQNTKVVLAATIFASNTKITASDNVTHPVLQISDSSSLIEPNAIVRYLAGTKELKPHEEELIEFEETALFDALHFGTKLEPALCEKLAPKLDSGDICAANIIVFGALHGLVTFVGKAALSQDLQLVLWHQKFSGNARVQPGVKAAAQYNSEAASSSPSSRAASSSASKPTPAAAPAPQASKPERTGAVKIKSGVEKKKVEGAILPKDGEKNIIITSALPYVNNVPHLGNIVGSVLSADIFARYAKARNYNCLYICGTDEYGTATETKALEEKMDPFDLCTKYHKIHKGVYDWFQIGFDHFGRTTCDKQTKIAQDIFLKLKENGYLEEHTSEQLYCPSHNGFLADRFVEGTCKYPDCQYDDARGDQCDKCGRLLNPLELINPRCKICKDAVPEKRETKHTFLSLDKLQDKVAAWNKSAQEKGKWSKNGVHITDNWLNQGLHPRAITRDLKWGIPVPLEGYENKVLYVWFDACIGYVSITADYTDGWEQWWKNPENVNLYQFMGKDNVPFHTVVFPSSQIGTGENWTQLHHLSTTEYLQYEGGKFSKSRNLGVFGNNAQEVGVSPSVWRYYLAASRPENSDTQFSWVDFVTRNNSELLANLGNFVNRIMKFVNAKYNGVVPDYKPTKLESYEQFEKDVNKLLKEYVTDMEGVHLRHGLEVAMQISARGNQFLQENKLDNNLLANYPDKCAALVGVGLNLIYLLSAVLTPFMPETSALISEQLAAPERSIPDVFDLAIEGGHNINKAQYLFSRIDEKKIDEWKAKFGGNNSK